MYAETVCTEVTGMGRNNQCGHRHRKRQLTGKPAAADADPAGMAPTMDCPKHAENSPKSDVQLNPTK